MLLNLLTIYTDDFAGRAIPANSFIMDFAQMK